MDNIVITYPDGYAQTFASAAQVADAYGAANATRLAKQREIEELKAEESVLESWLVANLPKSQTTMIAGQSWSAKLKSKTVAQVKDWDALRRYVLDTERFEFIQKRVSQSAIEEMWDAGETVPGVEPYEVKSISIGRVK